MMKKNSFLAFVALFVAAAGVLIGLAAYFKNRSSYLYDDDDDFLFDDPEDLEYYAAEVEEISPEEEEASSSNEGEDISF